FSALVRSIGFPVIALVGFGAATDQTFRRSPPLYLAALYFVIGAVALGAHAYFNLFLDPRHGLVLSLILTVPATIAFVNLLAAAFDRERKWLRALHAFVVVALLVGLFGGVKYYDSHAYWITAGRWLAQNTSRDARVIGNNNQVMFYGGFVNND